MVTIMNMGSGSEEELDWVVVKNVQATPAAVMDVMPAYVAPALQTWAQAEPVVAAVPSVVMQAAHLRYFPE